MSALDGTTESLLPDQNAWLNDYALAPAEDCAGVSAAGLAWPMASRVTTAPAAAKTAPRTKSRRGMPLMVGGMVETRLGMTAGAHLAAALGGVPFVDLDTAWLLQDDPYAGGYRAEGPHYSLGEEPGLGIDGRP